VQNEVETRQARPWQKTFDVLLLSAVVGALIARSVGFLSARQLAYLLGLAFGLACAGYLISMLRGDPERPGSIVPLAIVISLFLAHELVFGGVGPHWAQAVVLFVLLLTLLPSREPRSGSRGGVDRLPPWLYRP